MSTPATARQREREAAEETNENNRSTRPAVNEPYQPSSNDPAPPEVRYVPMRARFICTEITHTQRGVTCLKLDARHDGNIRKEESLVAGNNPVGECTIEVADSWAEKNAVHGAVFYLMSTNQKS